MNKMFLATCLLAASVFAAEAEKANAAENAAPQAVAPAPVAETQATVAEPAPVAKAEPVAKVEPAKAEPAKEAPAEPAVAVAPAEKTTATEESTSSRKKKKMIENAVFSVNQIDFDINADFELEAGKVFWTSEDDDNSDNLETWNGKANLAILAETKNFKGKVAFAFYPGDLKTDSDNNELKGAEDYFSLDEAWAYQSKGRFSFKLGRWDNTDKNGDYFGGYIDGYNSGFLSTQDPENQLEFGITPNKNLDFELSFISKAAHLNQGDLRAVVNFHDFSGLPALEMQLGYRCNLFDKVHNSDAIVKHNASFKFRLPLVQDFFTVFGEVALMDFSDDIVVPITGGIEMNFKTVDRVILEAEFVGDRDGHQDFTSFKTKHIKDVLAALYLEKALTDRFSLSAGFHSYGASKDFMLSGNLIGRIN